MIKLHDYQEEAVQLALDKNALVVLPTGVGKSYLSYELMKRYNELTGKRVVFISDRIDLARQNYHNAKPYLGDVGLCCASLKQKDTTQNFIFSTILTLAKMNIENVGLIIIDESHVVAAKSYTETLKLYPEARVFGMTATPFNHQGYIYGKGKLWEAVTYTKHISFFIERGVLVPPRLVGAASEHEFEVENLKVSMGDFNQGEINSLVSDMVKVRNQVKDAHQRTMDRECILWACANIEHAENVKSILNELEPDSAICYHSETEERFEEMTKILSDKYRHIVFISVLSQGFDYPRVDTVVFMRPIRSSGLYIQIVGRALRVDRKRPHKNHALILDYARVVESCGPIDNPVVVSKGKAKSTKKLLLDAELKKCIKCLSFIPKKTRVCPECKAEFWAEVPARLDSTSRAIGRLFHDPNYIDKSWEKNNIIGVTAVDTVSMNFNAMIVINYNTDKGTVKEFFVKNQFWNKQKLQNRMAELQIKWTGKSGVANRVPTTIWTKKNDKNYLEVKKMEF